MRRNQHYTIVLIIGILSSLAFRCGEPEIDENFTKRYTYTNETNYSIRIEDWQEGNRDSYLLEPSKQIVFQVELGIGGNCMVDGIEIDTSDLNCLLVTSDSLKIVFDDSKSMIFKQSDPGDVNILNEKNYTYEKKGQLENFWYAFTQKDYDKAKDCDGHCD